MVMPGGRPSHMIGVAHMKDLSRATIRGWGTWCLDTAPRVVIVGSVLTMRRWVGIATACCLMLCIMSSRALARRSWSDSHSRLRFMAVTLVRRFHWPVTNLAPLVWASSSASRWCFMFAQVWGSQTVEAYSSLGRMKCWYWCSGDLCYSDGNAWLHHQKKVPKTPYWQLDSSCQPSKDV